MLKNKYQVGYKCKNFKNIWEWVVVVVVIKINFKDCLEQSKSLIGKVISSMFFSHFDFLLLSLTVKHILSLSLSHTHTNTHTQTHTVQHTLIFPALTPPFHLLQEIKINESTGKEKRKNKTGYNQFHGLCLWVWFHHARLPQSRIIKD